MMTVMYVVTGNCNAVIALSYVTGNLYTSRQSALEHKGNVKQVIIGAA